MNVETGEIKEFKDETELEKAQRTGEWVRLERRPNPGCKHCHGQGHRGKDIVTDRYILCSCVKKRPLKKGHHALVAEDVIAFATEQIPMPPPN